MAASNPGVFSRGVNSRGITSRGFTLVEMVVGMVVMAIALVLMATMLYPMAEQSARGVHRAKAAQLGQAVLAELAGRRLDVKTPIGGGQVTAADGGLTCGATGATGSPADWELLDDFHNFDNTADTLIDGEQYEGYRLQISITCESGLGWQGGAKLASLVVTAPDGERFEFAQLRGNF